MNGAPSDSSLPFEPRASLELLTAGQILRQLGVIVIVAAAYSGLLAGYLRLTGEPGDTPAADIQPPPATVTPSPPETVQPQSETAVAEPSASPTPGDSPPPTTPAVSFSQDVLPIFESRCFQCHGTSRTEGGLALHDYQAVLAGSRGGPVVEPGDADSSVIVELVVSGDMPRRGPSLLPAEIETIIDWVNAGAPDN